MRDEAGCFLVELQETVVALDQLMKTWNPNDVHLLSANALAVYPGGQNIRSVVSAMITCKDLITCKDVITCRDSYDVLWAKLTCYCLEFDDDFVAACSLNNGESNSYFSSVSTSLKDLIMVIPKPMPLQFVHHPKCNLA